MKFGVREICDIVLRAKTDMQIGTTKFKADEPVMYFDTAKTSTIEGAATTVYATGGKGNTRLIAWEGDKTVTFTFEDALMSPMGFSILSGAGLVEASATHKINMHATSKVVVTAATGNLTVDLADLLPEGGTLATVDAYGFVLDNEGNIAHRLGKKTPSGSTVVFTNPEGVSDDDVVTVLVDYYVEMQSGVTQLDVTADKFAGSYYLEADTLFRRQSDGKDLPAQFVIPNCKIQSNFSFAMAPTGDPSTFTFTMDAFPGYTKFDRTKEVLFALQIMDGNVAKG